MFCTCSWKLGAAKNISNTSRCFPSHGSILDFSYCTFESHSGYSPRSSTLSPRRLEYQHHWLLMAEIGWDDQCPVNSWILRDSAGATTHNLGLRSKWFSRKQCMNMELSLHRSAGFEIGKACAVTTHHDVVTVTESSSGDKSTVVISNILRI